MSQLRPLASLVAAIAMTGLTIPAGFAQGAAEPFAQLPRSEVRGSQIGWHVNDTLEAFVHAVENNKALIVVFGDKSSRYTMAMSQRVAPCPQLNQLAGAAVFAFASPNVDEYARRMAVHLRLTDYPTISVIEPRTDKVTELYRLEGFFDAETIADTLQAALRRTRLWPAGMASPRPLPLPAGLACTPETAKRLISNK
jgi:hypothetical protein